jgi:phosphatidylglycerol:prolipoprotein diacylglycerol transferase
MVGDDYGFPTSVPWAVEFPQGLPPTTAASLAEFGFRVPEGVSPTEVLAVHPTMLYETAIMLAVFMLLWKLRRRAGGTGWLFGAYLAFAGAERFFVEFYRAKDDRFFAGFTLAQVTSVAIIVLGVIVVARLKNAGEASPGSYLAGKR